MARAERSVDINAPIDHVYDVVTNVEAFPEFIPEMKSVSIDETGDGYRIASYEFSMFKMTVRYTLKLTEDRPNGVSWTLMSSKLLKNIDGSWRLEKTGENTTRAIYSQELSVRGLVPKSVSSALSNVNLPTMLKQFKDRSESTWTNKG